MFIATIVAAIKDLTDHINVVIKMLQARNLIIGRSAQ